MLDGVKYYPVVCCVNDTYQIVIVTQCEALIKVRVGEKYYYNHSNGIRISSPGVHKISVPTCELDREQEYHVIAEKLSERLSYFSKPEEAVEEEFKFKPLKKEENIRIYHIADSHGMYEQSVNIVKNCGSEIDLLVLNGDISSTSDTFEDMTLWCRIASEITKGEIPCVVSRGNHDLRGPGAQKLADCLPTDFGRSYYTFRVGCVWGILVDSGEDKEDTSVEYGGTICCHDFRLEQEKMIMRTVNNASNEYRADGVKYRVVISHIPFTFKRNSPFDIEKNLYSNWAKAIKDNINPHLMLCGHTHTACISKPGDEYDELGNPCTVVVGSNVSGIGSENPILGGALVKLNADSAHVTVNTYKDIIIDEKIRFLPEQ